MTNEKVKGGRRYEEVQLGPECYCGCGAAPANSRAPPLAPTCSIRPHATAMPALPLPVCLLLGVALLCPLGSAAFATADGPPPQLYPGLYAGASAAEEYEAMRNSLRELEADALRRIVLRDLQAQEQAMEQMQAMAAAMARSSREEQLPPLLPPLQPGGGAAESLPLPLPLVRAYADGPNVADISKEEPPVKKKNYMSLCLFKICNMGRKRTNRS